MELIRQRNTAGSIVPVAERIERALSLDLSPIMYKLVQGEAGYLINCQNVQQIEREYKRFLCLHLMYPEEKIVPNRYVDAFWHAHILDTMKYAADCGHIFGHFLHHFPYFGLRGEDDARQLQDAFVTTKQLYQMAFGGVFGDASADCQVSDCDAEQCYPNVRVEHTRPQFEYAKA